MSRRRKDAIIQEVLKELRTAGAVRDAVDEAVIVGLLGLNRTDGRCLDILDREGRMTAGELARAAGLTTGAVTGVLDRLETAGYVRRERDPSDRRRVFVEPTERTRRVGAEVYGDLGTKAAAALRRYTVDQLTAVLDFIRLDRELYESLLTRIQGRVSQRSR
jgi:DNA-binding MarR family transcriptional regulator